MKKVVLTIPDFCTGGAEKMVAELAAGIDKNKFEVTVIVIRKPLNNAIEDSIGDNVNIVYLNKEMGFDIKTLFECNKVLSKIKPDIIHTHIQSFMYCLLYIMFHKVKMLHTIHNIPEEESKGIRRKILKILFKTKKAIPVGISDKITEKTNLLYQVSNTETVYNPVDENIFYPVADRKIESSHIRFISVGRLVEQKNFELLIDSFAEFASVYTDVTLDILGDGPLYEELNKKIHMTGSNNIHLCGNKTNIADYLRNADVFILTSKFEGLPMTILEAMAVGLPIICTDVGGNADVVKENGILIEKQNKESVVNALKRMHDKDVRMYCSKKSLELSSKYYLDKIVNDYEKLYYKYSI